MVSPFTVLRWESVIQKFVHLNQEVSKQNRRTLKRLQKSQLLYLYRLEWEILANSCGLGPGHFLFGLSMCPCRSWFSSTVVPYLDIDWLWGMLHLKCVCFSTLSLLLFCGCDFIASAHFQVWWSSLCYRKHSSLFIQKNGTVVRFPDLWGALSLAV